MARHIIQKTTLAPDGRKTAPAALRNTAPLIEALKKRLPRDGRILELASGTGQHAAAFAEAFPALEWTPSDVDKSQRDSILAWRRESGRPNLSRPLEIDVATPWPVQTGQFQSVLTINLLHLVPLPHVSHLFQQSYEALSHQGNVLIYGPFLRGTEYASEGDRTFDRSLRDRDPEIGYKSKEAVLEIASTAGFACVATDELPANNLLLTFLAS